MFSMTSSTNIRQMREVTTAVTDQCSMSEAMSPTVRGIVSFSFTKIVGKPCSQETNFSIAKNLMEKYMMILRVTQSYNLDLNFSLQRKFSLGTF